MTPEVGKILQNLLLDADCWSQEAWVKVGWAELDSHVCGLSLPGKSCCLLKKYEPGLWAAFLWGDHSPHDPTPGL